MTELAIQHLARADKVLARLIRKVGPCALRPKSRRPPFQALVRSVTFQQLNGAVAEKIFGRVLALYPETKFPTPGELLATPDAKLRAAGLSRNKIAAVKDIAAKTLEGIVPDLRAIRRMPNEEIIERLTTVRGVGPWTVEMLLIFTLGREDVLPVTDFGVRKGFALTYGLEELPAPKELLAHGEKWRPHRTTAAWYMWRAVDMVGVLP
jgi:3-methyladenine DNA glycosylase/8-oxoguanine DNA glycosylase